MMKMLTAGGDLFRGEEGCFCRNRDSCLGSSRLVIIKCEAVRLWFSLPMTKGVRAASNEHGFFVSPSPHQHITDGDQ